MQKHISSEGVSSAAVTLQENPSGLKCFRNRALLVLSGVHSVGNLLQVCWVVTLATHADAHHYVDPYLCI
jgi:hypothetical protein